MERSVHEGRIWRVKTAASGNVTIATGLNVGDVVNGYTIAAEGEQILLPAQTDPAENGIYSAGANPKRTFAFDTFAEHIGLQVVVTSGSAAGSTYLCTAVEGGVIDTDDITFAVQYAVAAQGGRLVKSIAGGAGTTALTSLEAANDIVELTGTITGNRTVTVPNTAHQWTVFNNTTGSFSVTVLVSGQTGVVVGSGKRAILYANGTDVVRVTADV